MSLWMHRVSRLWLWIASIVEGCLNNVIASVCVNYHDCTKTIYQLQASKCFKTNVCNTNFVFLFHCSHFTSINANDETAGVCLCLWHWFEQWWQRLVQSYVLMGVQNLIRYASFETLVPLGMLKSVLLLLHSGQLTPLF